MMFPFRHITPACVSLPTSLCLRLSACLSLPMSPCPCLSAYVSLPMSPAPPAPFPACFFFSHARAYILPLQETTHLVCATPGKYARGHACGRRVCARTLLLNVSHLAAERRRDAAVSAVRDSPARHQAHARTGYLHAAPLRSLRAHHQRASFRLSVALAVARAGPVPVC